MNKEITITSEKPKCFCGVFGVYGSPEAAMWTYYGLHALQHRGQEAAGIVSRSFNENNVPHFNIYKGEGLVSEVFSDFHDWGRILSGDLAIGHNRYSTTGSSGSRKNIQPFMVHYHSGNLAVAHNGNLTNERKLRKELIKEGAIFQTSTDSEVVLHLIARSKKEDQIDQIVEAVSQIAGAYSLLIQTDDKLIAARDPQGFRPLSIGKKEGSFIIASETCAFDIISAEPIREINPGEMVIIDKEALETGEIKSIDIPGKKPDKKHCIFEFIYFSRPDSRIFDHNVDKIRRRLGKALADNHPVYDKDGERVIVISVPDSSNTAALGYANRLKKNGVDARFELGLIRSHYIGRTFIEPEGKRHKTSENDEVGKKIQEMENQSRQLKVRIKFNTVKGVLVGRTVVVVDDSIVRGTTSKRLMKLIREANPKAIHLRISSPPIMHPCFYGMDFPSREELIAFKKEGDIEKIKEHIGVDSLEYLTIDEMLSAVYDDDPNNYCTACFSGKYPTDVDLSFKKEMHELNQ